MPEFESSDFEMYVSPSAAPAARLNQKLAMRAAERLGELLGENPPESVNLIRKRSGFCHICGAHTKMTYEHIPPRSAGNSQPERVADFRHALLNPHERFPKRGWHQQQRGVGLYVTCSDCNGKAGREYVPDYSNFVNSFGDGVVELLAESNFSEDLRGIRISFKEVRIGRVVRQALYMLVAASGSSNLINEYPCIRRILEGSVEPLANDLRVLLTVVQTNTMRHTPLHSWIDYKQATFIVATEVAHFPFAWLLQIGPTTESNMVVMNSYFEIPLDRRCDVTIESPVGHLVSPSPGDYRSETNIETEGGAPFNS